MHEESLPPEETPWKIDLPVARVTLDAPGWPAACGPRIFRGALIHALMPLLPGGEHSDWTGRLDDEGETLNRPAPILYRVHRGRLSLWLSGPRAHAHARILGETIRALQLPGQHEPSGVGRVIPCTVSEVRLSIEPVEATLHRAFLYRLVTPFFPSRSLFRRRPHVPDLKDRGRWPGDRDPLTLALLAWANRAITLSLQHWLPAQGLPIPPGKPVTVQLLEYETRPCLEFARTDRGVRDLRHGFTATFLSNARLPDGLGLGAHTSEGYGEIRALGECLAEGQQHRTPHPGSARRRKVEAYRAEE